MLPRRRKPAKSGIDRAQRRYFPQHEKWVRGHQCVVPGCENREIQFAHIRSAANAGTGLKPSSAFGISCCALHHKEQHSIGQPAFERKYGLDLFAIAAEFARRSPDRKLRDALKEMSDA